MPLGSLKLYLYGGAALVILLGLGFSHYKAYNYGVMTTEVKYIKQIAEINRTSAELLKKEIENHNAFVEEQDKKIIDLEEKNARLEQTEKENASEAAKDPDAERPALGKSSVMRLNRIR